MDDIVPGLLDTIKRHFGENVAKNSKVAAALGALESGKANYLDANIYSIELGEALASTLTRSVTGDTLPDGRMYFNIAERILNETLKENFDLISDYSKQVQDHLNREAGLHLKVQAPELNQDRINGFVNRLSSEKDFDKVAWILDDPIVNFSQSIVDEFIDKNADFQARLGLSPKITRKIYGKACDWCRSLAGTYDYKNAPKDIYRRHERCHCTVEYHPGDGRGIQNVHSKEWREKERREKIEVRKTIGIDLADYKELDFFGLAKLQDDSDKWYNELTKDEHLSIVNYTRGEYEAMNSFLRGRNLLPEQAKIKLQTTIDDFSASLSKFSLEEDIITFRGVSQSEYNTILKGNLFKDFKSSSTQKDKAITFAKDQSEDFVVKFKIPKGTNGAYLGTNSEYRNESEFTLNKNSKYTVRKTPEGLEVTIIG